MTERLYYEQAYLTEFDAEVTRRDARDGKCIVALDRSAFYPTSGGQPFDTGKLNGLSVTDVFVDREGEVWHEIQGELSVGEQVHGCIDWDRRFDHMQQHGGEHMIAGAVWKLTGGTTIGLHLGAECSSIDVELPDGATKLSPQTLEAIEDDVNAHIQQDHPIRCWFPTAAELKQLPLRKQPTVSEHVRIVAIGDFEMVACGGTHPSSTGQIGLIKIIDAAPARGKLRLSFMCGARAYADYRRNYNNAWQAAQKLSTHPDKLAANVEALLQRLHDAETALAQLRREKLAAMLPIFLQEATPLPGGERLVCAELDVEPAGLKDFASKLIAGSGVIALLAARTSSGWSFVFARSADVNCAMGALLSSAAKPLGGKGGGRPDFAQGGGSLEILYAAKALLQKGNDR